MVEITCDLESSQLHLKVSGGMFADTVETLKNNHCTWNPDVKKWVGPILDLSLLERELVYSGEDVEISELTRRQVAEYSKSLKELDLSSSRRKLRLDLMNFPPLQGKSPNETFQVQDIARAMNQNRFLFNWEMGLGKSYALAVLLTSMRSYGLANKSVILSTGVGVYNLKDELLKFCKGLNPDEILPISSVSEMEDRDIFNIEKFKYSIIIMTYDTFTEINNFYYDKSHSKVSDIKKVGKLEENLKNVLQDVKAEIKASGKKITDSTKEINEDPRVKKAKLELSNAREKLFPSRKIDYQKTSVPFAEWLEGKDGMLFLDECHSLGNPSSRRSAIVNMNVGFFKYRYEFTGTLADKYEKLYEPLFILDKWLVKGKNYRDWLYEYNEIGTRWSKYAVNPNGWRMDKIALLNKNLLSEYASKRKMQDCLDLPLNYSVPTILLDMTKEHREIYEGFVKENLRLLKERQEETGDSNQRDSILRMFQIFSMACDNIECIRTTPLFEKFSDELKNKINNYDYLVHNKKLEALSSILEERVDESDERGIVWYQHPLTKDSLVKYLKKYDPIVIEAGLTTEELNSRIKEFKGNEKHKMIIASINVMNTSVTLTECKFSVYLERTYSYNVWSQSKGRIWRPSQTSVTRVYTMSYKNSIDNLQLDNLNCKGEVVNSLLSRSFIDQNMWKKIFNFNLGDSF